MARRFGSAGVVDERGRLWTWFQIERAGWERRHAPAVEPLHFVGVDAEGMAIYRDGEDAAPEQD